MIWIKKRQKSLALSRRFIISIMIVLLLVLTACADEEPEEIGDEFAVQDPVAEEVPPLEEEAVVEAPVVEEEPLVAEAVVSEDRFPILLSELIGDDVMTLAQEDLGKVQDVIIGLNGNLDYAVISPEGLLNLGEDNFLIPLIALSPVAEEDAFLVDQVITLPVVQAAPRFIDDWTVFDDPAWDDPFFNYWQGLGLVTQPGAVTPPGLGDLDGPAFIRASRLYEDDVMNAAMEDLGKIAQIIITNDPLRADYAVVTPNAGLFNIGDNEEFVIPLNRLRVSDEEDAFFLAVEEAALPDIPRFRRDAPPDLRDPAWEEPLIIFWAAQPIIVQVPTATPIPPPTPAPATPVPPTSVPPTLTPQPPPTATPEFQPQPQSRPIYFPPPCRHRCPPPPPHCLPYGQPFQQARYGPPMPPPWAWR